MSYYLAPSLAQLRAQVDATWPSRSKASDGWVGDTSHQARKSDHNPAWDAGGVVRAIDVTSSGIDANALIAAAVADPRTSYVIHKGVIRGASQFKPRKYTGSNAHNHHVHISIKSTKGAEASHGWKLGKGGNVKPVGKPSKPAKKQPTDYKALKVDGKLGKLTVEALQIVMRAIKTYKRAVDGKFSKYSKIGVQSWLSGLGYYKRAVDGKFSKYSVIALQQFLAKKGHLDTNKWLVDGKFQAETVKALQRYLNTQN